MEVLGQFLFTSVAGCARENSSGCGQCNDNKAACVGVQRVCQTYDNAKPEKHNFGLLCFSQLSLCVLVCRFGLRAVFLKLSEYGPFFQTYLASSYHYCHHPTAEPGAARGLLQR